MMKERGLWVLPVVALVFIGGLLTSQGSQPETMVLQVGQKMKWDGGVF